jgi:MraZ protein
VRTSFTGREDQRIDAKGRVSIPAKFREVMAAADPDRPQAAAQSGQVRFVLAYGDHLEDHLRLYHIAGFERLRARIYAMPEDDEDREFLTYLCVTQTTLMEVAPDGRIVLPQKQREKLGIAEGDLAFLGYDDYAEVWKAETWAARQGAAYAARLAAEKAARGGKLNVNALINKRRDG